MGEFETSTPVVFVPSNSTIVDDWRPNGNAVAFVITLRSVTLALNVLPTKTFVTTLSATCSTGSVSSVALHADFAVKHTSFSFRESCHDMATHFVYLTTTTAKEIHECQNSNT